MKNGAGKMQLNGVLREVEPIIAIFDRIKDDPTTPDSVLKDIAAYRRDPIERKLSADTQGYLAGYALRDRHDARDAAAEARARAVASLKFSEQALPEPSNATAWVLAWKLEAGDEGIAFEQYNYQDRSFQIDGGFGAEGGVVIEASNDDASYYPIETVTAPGISVIDLPCRYIRPRATAGGPFSVTLFARRTTALL
jgi:hypothetical protein